MSSREDILKSIENSLNGKAKVELPNISLNNFEVFENKPEALQNSIKELGANFIKASPNNIANEIEKLIKSLNAKVVYNETSHKINHTNSTEGLNTPHKLQNADIAIIEASIAVAENGALWVEYGKLNHRALPAICQNLIVTINQQNIVNNMLEAYKNIPSTASGSNGGFIAGPSKTADIERALVLGAHGAFTVNVVMY